MKFEDEIEKIILPNLVRQTCIILNSRKTDLKNISWNTGESNTDADFSQLSKKCCEIAFKEINKNKDISLLINTPDLNLEFKDYKNNELIKKKIELKSTKLNGIIPGSMIKSLDINMWTIFCLRKKADKFEIRYGRYHLGMNISSHEKFQDRSPRPNLNFYQFQEISEIPKILKKIKNLDYWDDYADAAIKRILKPKNHSWQDDLVKAIIKKVLKNTKKFKDI
jgi:hypothetical protein